MSDDRTATPAEGFASGRPVEMTDPAGHGEAGDAAAEPDDSGERGQSLATPSFDRSVIPAEDDEPHLTAEQSRAKAEGTDQLAGEREQPRP